MSLTCIKLDLIYYTASCFTAVAVALSIKMICIIGTLQYRRNLETRLL